MGSIPVDLDSILLACIDIATDMVSSLQDNTASATFPGFMSEDRTEKAGADYEIIKFQTRNHSFASESHMTIYIIFPDAS